MPAGPLRLFVAVDVPEDLRRAVEESCRRIRAQLPEARWVPADNLHLTLAFLGPVEAERSEELARALRPVFAAAEAFSLHLEGAGTFPPRRPARVAWIGFGESAALQRLQEAVRDAAARCLGLEPEGRPFHPHLTLARCRRPWPRAAAERWTGVFHPGLSREFEVDRGVLYRSHLGSSGARYEALAAFPLEGEA
jgi:2'-5' RNA ligase